jgi:hypothetical protein
LALALAERVALVYRIVSQRQILVLELPPVDLRDGCHSGVEQRLLIVRIGHDDDAAASPPACPGDTPRGPEARSVGRRLQDLLDVAEALHERSIALRSSTEDRAHRHGHDGCDTHASGAPTELRSLDREQKPSERFVAKAHCICRCIG